MMKPPFFRMLFLMSWLAVALTSCREQAPAGNFVLHGHIKGLTKGTVYISRLKDSVFVPVDSATVIGKSDFTLSDDLSGPEIYYLKIKEIPGDSLLIFAEPGEMRVEGNLKYFFIKNNVSGSENHRLLEEYKEMISQFNSNELELTKAYLLAQRDADSILMDSLNRRYRGLLKHKYLYTANFAVKHSGKAIAPYLALTRLYDADTRLLDTVYRSLSGRIKQSKYGKQLENYLTYLKSGQNI